MKKPKKTTLHISNINTDGMQSRAEVNEMVVDEYAAIIKEKGFRAFPPLVVFTDTKTYWLADGFHRLTAATDAGLKCVDCIVHEGTRIDALRHAIGANAQHGLAPGFFSSGLGAARSASS